MNLLNRQVIHKSSLIGTGIVVEVKTGQNGQIHLVIQFAVRRLELQYPQAFEGFIRAVDDEVQQQALADLDALRNIEKEKRAAEIRFREEKRIEAEEAIRKKKLPGVFSVKRDGNPVVFYVFHDASRKDLFDDRIKEGYFWVPSENINGHAVYFWEMIREIRKGDLILHGYKGNVCAYSYAENVCYDCFEPEIMCKDKTERRIGRRIDCKYNLIPNPIMTNDYVDEIKRYSRQHYSAFDKDGNGQGVIAVLEKEIADLFIKEIGKRNPELVFMGEK